MDNAQKAIIVGVSLFITITLISVVVLITGIGNDAMRSSNKQLEGVSNNIASQLLADYDGTTITGASVIAAIKNFYDKPNFILAVDNSTVGTNGSAYNQNGWYSTKKKNGSAKLEASTDGKNFDNPPGRSSYFDKTKNYSCVLIEKNATIADNTPDITGLSSRGGISPTASYRSYIIYLEGTDTIMGVYFKKLI